MSGRLGVRVALLAVIGIAGLPLAPTAAPLPSAQASALARADSLAVVGQFGPAGRMLDSLEAAATLREDSRLRDAIQVSRARMAIGSRRIDDAERIVRPLLERVRASHDTLLWVQAMRVQARVYALQGKPKESAAAYRAAVRTARHGGLRQEQTLAEMAAAQGAMEIGRYEESADGFRRALALLGEDGDVQGRMRARAGLARALQNTDRIDEARREHLRVLELAARTGNVPQQAETQLNLGALEHGNGDLAKAEDHYLEALRYYRETNWPDRRLAVTLNLAILRLNAGRVADADSILSAELPVVYRPGVTVDRRARVLCQIGIVRREQDRSDEAIAWGRRALAPMDSVTVVTAVETAGPLIATLRQSGRRMEALALIDTLLRRLDARLTPSLRAELTRQRAGLMAETGRASEALPTMIAAVPPVPPRGTYGYDTIDLLSDIGLAYGTLGKRDSAIVWHRRASDSWEQWRRSAGNSSWREVLDDAAQRFAGRYAAAVLAGREPSPAVRASAAFDALQRHRARTLAERMHDPESGKLSVTTPVTAARLRTVLRPGELFLDVHATPETTLVIAVTRDTAAAWGAPARKDLIPRLSRLRDLLATPGAGSAAMRDQAAAALGRDLLGPGAGLMARANAVVVAAGALAQYPLGMLTAPGMTRPPGGLLSFVPSAALLAAARARTPAPGSSTLLAIARTRDDAGHELRGAREEAEWLTRRFAGAEARIDDDRLAPATIGSLTARPQVLHFAAHARDDAKRPWRSGLLLGRPGAPDAWLEAWHVARFHPQARLCVLTGCESVGGRGDHGETLEGLATAWLAAGVPTAIASQWDVDDHSAADFTRYFYDALAQGETVGASLRAAQEKLRALPATADPSHWAGFVTLGDPGTRVRLRAR